MSSALKNPRNPHIAKRMFGGWGIFVDGLTFAIIADLGGGQKLWLKADDDVRSRFERAGYERFTYVGKSKMASMGYYTAPEDAMDSQNAMSPWGAAFAGMCGTLQSHQNAHQKSR